MTESAEHHFPESRPDPWQAELRLRFNGDTPHLLAKGAAPETGRTRLIERHHKGPLIVQRPFYPEGDPCHVYLVHPPGGVVGGDELRIDVLVDANAHALLTTPAATKFYRCDGRVSSQTQELRAAGATLEWLPQENIFFRGADARTATRVHVDAHSRFIGWEINCLGLPARGEPFDSGALRLDLELWRTVPTDEPAAIRSGPFCYEMGTVPIFLDRLRLKGESAARGARWGLAGQEAVGTLLATPATREDVEPIRELVADLPYAAVSLVDGVLVLRALAPQAEALRNLFIAAWQRLRPRVIGRAAVLPRIWST
ncbi:MAG TPA: urease accessory protein UreD [Steroidobacteraceae bacterium]|nr:urease accessory protein UreD [Steroidobacteraceae bacterium]